MQFKQFFQLFLDSKQIQDELRLRDDITGNELWLVAKDIRRYPLDYEDTFNFARLVKFHGNSSREQGPQEIFNDYKGNLLYIPHENQQKLYKELKRSAGARRYLDHIEYIIRYIINGFFRTNPDPFYQNINLKKYTLPMDETAYAKLFKYEKITVSDIYKELLNIKFNLPKVPEEIDPKFKNLPRSILNDIYKRSKSPVQIAIESCNIRNNEDYVEEEDEYNTPSCRDIVGRSGIIHIYDELSFGPTKKEAYEWLVFSAKNRPIVNWPSYMIQQIDEDTPEVSISSFAVFRWFLNNLKSKYLTKSQTVYGPAGQTQDFVPMNHIARIITVDLENGIKTSPEKVFNNASQRLAKEHINFDSDWDMKLYKTLLGVEVIKSQAALDDEGKRMKHCVGGYGNACKLGQSLILSLPSSTAEIDPKTFKIYQHRGPSNANPPEYDQKLLHNWIKLQSEI